MATAEIERRSLIVQSDGTILLDVHTPGAEEARIEIAPFTELEKSPEHIHTYRMSPLSLWNAASAGLGEEAIAEALRRNSRYPVPENVLFTVRDMLARYGKIRLLAGDDPDTLFLEVREEALRSELRSYRRLGSLLTAADGGFRVHLHDRGTVKQELIKVGYPATDEAPLSDGDPVDFRLRGITSDGSAFAPRDYQREAAEAFAGDNRPGTGFGTIVLPCGAGKTVVGMTIMSLFRTSTLILTTNVAAVHQWIDELADKTHVPREEIGEYTGDRKVVKPITVATYQILVWRADREGDYPHFDLFRRHRWGLIIYDEVHLLPAPVFRVTAEIQAIRRLGLTATLVREDGREADVFSLVGPKRYDVPWKELEAKGWIAEARCFELRIDLPEDLKIPYATADRRRKYRIASENPLKIPIARQIIENHPDDPILVIGQYLEQLRLLSEDLNVPIITGRTPNRKREEIYSDFKAGRIRVLVVSKVANFAIDLPDASVAIQVSGTFGSRQEEAQRLGRILRPKRRNAFFYSVISRYTVEEGFGANRQKFLTEQGYKYHIEMISPEELQ